MSKSGGMWHRLLNVCGRDRRQEETAANCGRVAPEGTVNPEDNELRQESRRDTAKESNTKDRRATSKVERKGEEGNAGEDDEDEDDDEDEEEEYDRYNKNLIKVDQQQLMLSRLQLSGTQADGQPSTSSIHLSGSPCKHQRQADSTSSVRVSESPFKEQRVYKKSSPNNKMTLYLVNRDLVVCEPGQIDKLQGVILIHPEYKEKKVYGQVTLTFRYGREDEEVMGLKFCNEAVLCVSQLYPPYREADHEIIPLQRTLVEKLGSNAYAFTMTITPLAPPSVQLVPAKEYVGAPIGIIYDVRVYVAELPDEKLCYKACVRMGIRVIQRHTRPSSLPATANTHSLLPSQMPFIGSRIKSCKTRIVFEDEIIENDENVGPHAAVEKQFLLGDGRIGLEARLNRAIYAHGDTITVNVSIVNNSSKSVRKIKVFVVQHVDVCMFSNGTFKNVVALVESREGYPVNSGCSMQKTYTLMPAKGSTKNWIALEDSYMTTGATLASTVVCSENTHEERNVFAIYVSYYVKVKLFISAMGGDVSLKLPFTLMHSNTEPAT